MRRDLLQSIIAVAVFSILLGLAYPLAMTGISQVLFSDKANGSKIEVDGKVVGSELIGQSFQRPVLGPNGKPKTDADGNLVTVPDRRYFQSRPSATAYDPSVTYFSSLGPNTKELKQAISDNAKAYLALERPYNPGLTIGDIPPDAVQTSGSGVDPHISEANARIQAARVAKVRGIPEDQVMDLIDENTDGRFLGLLGEPGVNVLKLNIALDKEAGS